MEQNTQWKTAMTVFLPQASKLLISGIKLPLPNSQAIDQPQDSVSHRVLLQKDSVRLTLPSGTDLCRRAALCIVKETGCRVEVIQVQAVKHPGSFLYWQRTHISHSYWQDSVTGECGDSMVQSLLSLLDCQGDCRHSACLTRILCYNGQPHQKGLKMCRAEPLLLQVTMRLDYCNELCAGLLLKSTWKLHLVQNAAPGSNWNISSLSEKFYIGYLEPYI